MYLSNHELLKAVDDGDIDSLKRIIHEGANPAVQDSLALRHAIQQNQPECAEFLINSGANPGTDNHTLLQHAATYGYKECIDILIRHGERPNLRNHAAIRAAVVNGHKECWKTLAYYAPDEDFLKGLVDEIIDPDIKSAYETFLLSRKKKNTTQTAAPRRTSI